MCLFTTDQTDHLPSARPSKSSHHATASQTKRHETRARAQSSRSKRVPSRSTSFRHPDERERQTYSHSHPHQHQHRPGTSGSYNSTKPPSYKSSYKSKGDTSISFLPFEPPRVGHYNRSNFEEFARDEDYERNPWLYVNDSFFSSAERDEERRKALTRRTEVMDDEIWGKSIKLKTDAGPVALDSIVHPCDMLDLVKKQVNGEGTFEPLIHLPTGRRLQHTQGSFTTKGGVDVFFDRYDVYHHSAANSLSYVGRKVAVQWDDDRMPPARGQDTTLREHAFLWNEGGQSREEFIDECHGHGYLPGVDKEGWRYKAVWSREPVEP